MSGQSYQPPPGPPPGHSSQGEYAPPPGPPPNYQQRDDDYNPPPGPPPSHNNDKTSSTDAQPPHYQQHDWQSAVPDTSSYPPPPAITNDFSPTANASWDDAQRGAAWCRANPLWPAQKLNPVTVNDVHSRRFNIVAQQPFSGEVRLGGPGRIGVRSPMAQVDALLQPNLPIYAALTDSPMALEKTKTVYFELKILSLGAPQQRRHLFSRGGDQVDAGIAIGFFAPPYPSFRLPGWQRGSLGVHSDDGRRYINDTHGGIDFTKPFQAGQTVGLGMNFAVSDKSPAYSGSPNGPQMKVEVFFTREGKRTGEWDLHEERDELDKTVQGLEGDFDIFAAIGVFGPSEFEVIFDERDWLYHP